MPVSYPAQVPTSGITSLSWTNATASLISRSPFTFQGQSQNYPGAIRYAQISVENLNREDAEDWVGFLDSLHGTKGTFLFGDPMAKVPMGTGGGSPTIRAINNASRDSITVNTSLTSNVTAWLKRGDWIQIGTGLDSRLYKVLNQTNIAGSTGASGLLNLWPSYRRTPVIGEAVIINNPKGLFRRSSGVFNYSEENGCKYSLSFDCEEVI
mgnify:FL=1